MKSGFKSLFGRHGGIFFHISFFVILIKIKKTFSVLIKRFPIKKSSIMEQKSSMVEH